jgi:hypothetical protein
MLRAPGSAGDEFDFCGGQLFPFSRWEAAEVEIADADAQEAQGGMADGGGHATHLAVLAFDEFEADPAIGHAFAEADGRDARRNLRLRVEEPGAAGQGFVALDDESVLKLVQGFAHGDFFDLRPILAFVGVARVEELCVPMCFIAQEEEAFGIGIEAADGVDVFGETELGEGTVGGTIRGELREHAIGFVECDEHGPNF